MTKLYQKIRLSDHVLIGAPAALPPELEGLQDSSLVDLSWIEDDDVRAAFDDMGLWPVEGVTPVHDERTHQPGGWGVMAADLERSVVLGTRLIEARPAVEALRVNKVDFLRLFDGDETRKWNKLKRQIAGMVEADYDDPAKALLVQAEAAMDRFNALPEFVELDHPETAAFVSQLLVAAQVLTPSRAVEVLSNTLPA